MYKLFKILQNHEMWLTCPICGEVWDARARGEECPKCRKRKAERLKRGKSPSKDTR